MNRLKIQSVKRERRKTRIYSTRKRYALCPTADSQLRHQSDLFMQHLLVGSSRVIGHAGSVLFM